MCVQFNAHPTPDHHVMPMIIITVINLWHEKHKKLLSAVITLLIFFIYFWYRFIKRSRGDLQALCSYAKHRSCAHSEPWDNLCSVFTCRIRGISGKKHMPSQQQQQKNKTLLWIRMCIGSKLRFSQALCNGTFLIKLYLYCVISACKVL